MAASSAPLSASLAVLLAANYCRRHPLLHWSDEALPSVGRRAEKYCFRVELRNLQHEPCGDLLLALLPAQLSLVDMEKARAVYQLKALLVTLQHPYILPVMDVDYLKEKHALLVLQPFVARGSLKDLIYRVEDPATAFGVKYRLERAHALPFPAIAKWSRQVLEALAALRRRGLVCDHLRSTNVLVDRGNARIAEMFTPLLAIDRYRDSRQLTVSLEQCMDIDLLLFGHVVYEMATGLELASPQPEKRVLEMVAPAIADVLQAIFCHPDRLRRPSDPAQLCSDMEKERHSAARYDDVASVGGRSTGSSRCKKHLFLVDVDRMLEDFALFAAARDVAPIRTLFSGFRLDSDMKSTIKCSMRINASRSQAHIVRYNDQEALCRTRRRAEHRVYEEREKQQRRIQQLALGGNPTSKGTACSSQSLSSRRKAYRADSFRTHTKRVLSQSGSDVSSTSASTA